MKGGDGGITKAVGKYNQSYTLAEQETPYFKGRYGPTPDVVIRISYALLGCVQCIHTHTPFKNVSHVE